jgi:sugar O-acyltransferase (sialic acid O-acetyltransferase NeuD family)
MAEPLILVAASGLAREVAAAVRAAGILELIGMLDDDPAMRGGSVSGVRVIGASHDAVDHQHANFVVCAGSGRARKTIVERLRRLGIERERFATVVHPSVSVPTDSVVGVGSVLLANVVLTADVRLGEHVVVMPGAVLTHDDVVSDFATMCAGAVLGGGVSIGERAYLGMNSSVRENVVIGDGVTLGMGAVVLTDVPAEQTWVGIPARPLKSRSALAVQPSPNGAHS